VNARRARRAHRRTPNRGHRIVEAAIAILDAEGEGALTFRALASHLATGSGAIYWHVTSKDDLLAASAEAVISAVLAAVDGSADPKKAIRAIALGVFDAIDAHPWVGTQLSREPWQTAVVQMFEGMGGKLQALGVPRRARFYAASTLVSYVLGLAGQYAAAARMLPQPDRAAFLGTVADRWVALAPEKYPFLHEMSAQLRDHDDRKQFLAGVDLILAGIASL
jgi:AcrR family transcriptional regulator